jgi:hypothetical protein
MARGTGLGAIKSTVYLVGCLTACTSEILYGTPQWHQASYAASQDFVWAMTPFSLSANTTIPFTAPLYPSISVTIKPPTVFTDAHLQGIYAAVATINTYVQSLNVTPLTISIESTTAQVYDFPVGSVPLGMAYIEARRVVFFTRQLKGIDIFLVAIHEFLHVLGFGTTPWYSQLAVQHATLVYTGALPTQLAQKNISVDVHSGAHWSDQSQLSQGTENDVMNRYLHQHTRLSAESFSVVQQGNTSMVTRACRTTTDCNLIYQHYQSRYPDANETFSWQCVRNTPTLPGICHTHAYCSFFSCLPHGSVTIPTHYRLWLAIGMLVYLSGISGLRYVYHANM